MEQRERQLPPAEILFPGAGHLGGCGLLILGRMGRYRKKEGVEEGKGEGKILSKALVSHREIPYNELGLENGGKAAEEWIMKHCWSWRPTWATV